MALSLLRGEYNSAPTPKGGPAKQHTFIFPGAINGQVVPRRQRTPPHRVFAPQIWWPWRILERDVRLRGSALAAHLFCTFKCNVEGPAAISARTRVAIPCRLLTPGPLQK